ncbi:MAG TPA: efflux RND transporter periplasmic adaptor subunit, partial [Prolixibacteraceae bacterium]|nr:efflux RND transporter periplasmic adaptor subunit [Prolixibacteraceae bacterium]
LFAACGQKPENKTENSSATTTAERIYPVKVQKLERTIIERTTEYSANLEPWEKLFLAPANPGKISKIRVEVGDYVKKGQLLIQMDKTQLEQAKIQLKNLEKEYQRMKKLLETESIAQQQFDQVESQYEVTKSNINFLEENTSITAPFNGVITARYFEDGEVFNGSPNTQAGKAAIVTLEQISVLKATLNVSEQYFNKITTGQEVKLQSNVYPEEGFNGTIMNIFPTIDPLTRSFNIEIKVPNYKQKLRPGMFARLSIVIETAETIVVPASAVLQQEGTNNRYVFINENGTAKRVNVKLGKRFDDKLEIISDDIKNGQQLVVAGQAVLMDNDKVEVKN